MPIKEILLVALVAAAGHGFAWAFHNIGLSYADYNLIAYKQKCDKLIAAQQDAYDRLLDEALDSGP